MTGGRAVQLGSWACLQCASGGAIRWATDIDGDPAAEGPGGSLLLTRVLLEQKALKAAMKNS